MQRKPSSKPQRVGFPLPLFLAFCVLSTPAHTNGEINVPDWVCGYMGEYIGTKTRVDGFEDSCLNKDGSITTWVRVYE